jgi:hypothetical protein
MAVGWTGTAPPGLSEGSLAAPKPGSPGSLKAQRAPTGRPEAG